MMLAVPFSLIGAFGAMLDYNLSVAAWVGMIALMGLDAEPGPSCCSTLIWPTPTPSGRPHAQLRRPQERSCHSAVKRIRPKMMTVFTDFLGLMPIMWSMGTGADLMKRIAAPIIFGLGTSFAMELVVYPAIFLLWKWHTDLSKGTTVPTIQSIDVMAHV